MPTSSSRGSWAGLVLVVLAGLHGQRAAAADVEAGVGLEIAADLPDSDPGISQTRFGVGGGLRVPVRVRVGEGAWVRAELATGLAAGQDRVEWSPEGAGVRYHSTDHWALLTSSRLTVGPEVAVGGTETLRPFIGADLGLVWAQTWHSFGGGSASVVDPEFNAVDDPGNIDPYASQIAPTAGLHAGLAFRPGGPLAFEVEAGYNVSFLKEVALRKTPEQMDAVRSPIGLDPLRLGVAATFALGGSD